MAMLKLLTLHRLKHWMMEYHVADDSHIDTKYAVRLKACHNPQTFSALSEKFAKDDKHVYSEGQILKKANPATFEVLKDYYARDDKHVYFVNRIIEADVTTFIVLEDGYAKDNFHLFCLGNIVTEQQQNYLQ